jgi:hypothetical protein
MSLMHEANIGILWRNEKPRRGGACNWSSALLIMALSRGRKAPLKSNAILRPEIQDIE